MENIVIFGTGSRAEKAVMSCDKNKYNIVSFLDNNEKVQGQLFHNSLVRAPGELLTIKFDKILICSIAYEQIYKQLTEMYHIKPIQIDNHYYFLKVKLINYYQNQKIPNREINEILKFLENNGLGVFNYEFRKKYENMKINVEYDDIVKLFYVIHNGKKMYFKESFKTKDQVTTYYRFILQEQDIESPHRYLIDNMKVKENDIVIDAGVAEGNFALEVIDKVSKIYLIEVDKEWVHALKQTFKEYSDKVVFVDKFLTNINNDTNISLDRLVLDEKVNFIKMDIEGEEIKALEGASKTLKRSDNLKLDICVYHNIDDEAKVVDILKKYQYTLTTTKGYMFFINEETYESKELRFSRGLIRGVKGSEN